MNILYVAHMGLGTSSAWRYQALKDLGHRVTPVDTYPPRVIRQEESLLYRVVRRFFGPLDLAGANAAIIRRMTQENYDILWLNKALTVTARTLRKVHSIQPACRIVGYSPDDMYARHNQSRHFLQHLPLYDAFFTTKSYGVTELRSLGCPRVEFTGNAFDPHTQRPMELTDEDRRKYGAEVGFIGGFEADRAEQMSYLAQNGVPVQVIGSYWERWSNPPPLIKIRYGDVFGDEYTKAICATKINLGFLRKINRDLQTQRSVEIPACGAFMLAERTDEHLALFEEGKEAEFFASKQELHDKVRYYLAHPQQREQIAAAGRQRCLNSGYSYQERLREIMRQLDQDSSSLK